MTTRSFHASLLIASILFSPSGLVSSRSEPPIQTQNGGVSIHLPDRIAHYIDARKRDQPDNWIGSRRRHQRGDDVYNLNGRHQTETVEFTSRRPRKFFFTVENDRLVSDNFTILAPRRDRRYRLSYFNLTTPVLNVTAPIATGRYRIGDLPPGGRSVFRVRVKPGPAAHRGTRRAIHVLSASDYNDRGRDCVTAHCEYSR